MTLLLFLQASWEYLRQSQKWGVPFNPHCPPLVNPLSFRYWGFHEKGTLSYLFALGIDISVFSIERVYTQSTFYMKSAVLFWRLRRKEFTFDDSL